MATKYYTESKFASKEAATAYAYSEAGKEIKLLPIVFDEGQLPSFLDSILYLPVRNDDFEDVSIKLFASLNLLREDKESLKRTTEEETATFKVSMSAFIKETLDRLEKNERRNRIMAYICYIASCICLAFSLAESVGMEAIRNSDRIHAISFGEFYLNAYGKVATRDEVREVFGKWNIDNGSSFISQSPKDYDPQILENLVLAVEALKDKISK